MHKTQEWIRKSKIRCKYLAVALILLAFCAPFGYSYFGEAETNKEEQKAATSTPTDTSAKGFQAPGEAVVHAETPSVATTLLQNVKNTFSGTKIQANVDQPFGQGNNPAFANGKSCVYVTIEVIAPQGVFLKDENLIIEKPDAITINGPTSTSGGGSLRWCLTSTQPIQANITVKLADFPQTQTTFQVSFLPTLAINDLTDSSSSSIGSSSGITNASGSANFYFDQPITFIAQIAPRMVQGLREAKLIFNTTRCGAIVCEPINAEIPMSCSFDGICNATVPPCATRAPFQGNNQSFGYTFQFEDINGNKFQQSNTGTLEFP